MDSVTQGVNRLGEVTFGWLPQLIAAILILLIGALIAAGIRSAIYKILSKMHLSERIHTGQGGAMISRAVPHPEHTLAYITYWVIMIGVISLAVAVLGIPVLTAFVAAIYSYLPNVLAALLIFLVAGAVAAAVSGFAVRTLGDTPTGKVIATAVPFVVMGIATFMILDQLQIAETIVTITYAALMGAVALGLALAFGLGGREVAATMLNDAYHKGLEQRGKIKRDVQVGKERADGDVRDAVQKARRRR